MKDSYEWLAANWKAGLAFIYSLVVVFDFIVVPSWIGLNRPDLFKVIEAVKLLTPEMQQLTLQIAFRSHEAFTLQGSGLFHLAFGALLTGAAVTKDQLLLTREQKKGASGLMPSAAMFNAEPASGKTKARNVDYEEGSGASAMRPKVSSDDDDLPRPTV
jgi:hypothetical protein